ncbi:CDP-glycerol glycerophosphotransferase family protein [Paenilisteria rocourtiae]|uniref:CDP-glycerol glycerophosphotransferase (TagB/SpsB family) n=1 Tax=Listeria rocourtiae TaxID=647910 RepID=A0A4R6ZQ87_9LIST|nr:CDP-glycerol glycerophosphotransferase family protein [Listeria rocourtiae]EUJ48384.1 putative glycerol phosphotransferase [Listeria rocourtiae FSL F6-920]MBC1605876.1 hypothetical protein [Listeria rocourtiae]TDR54757.1 CDP-glycerol glycerophosphotransferase (TagB/SpsB family) [Listeria rocourtiae]
MKLIMRYIIALFRLFPVKNIMLFESMSGFQDNSKALFEEIIAQNLHQTYQIIWFVADPKRMQDQDYPNVHFMKKSGITKKSLRYLYYNCVAKYCFYTHEVLGYRTDDKQICFFLTHGTPLKDSRGCFGPTENHTHILATSYFAAELRATSLLGGAEKMQVLGFPRNDKMFREDAGTEIFLAKQNYKKLIVWLPTFKHINNSDRVDFATDSEQDISLMSPTFFKALNEKLVATETLLIIKFHPNQDLRFVSFCDLSHIVTLSNQDMLQENIDLYALLGKSDALITDFSSVYFDYLLLNKPIGFELADMNNYSSGRGFLVDEPLDYMPGAKIHDETGFLQFIHQVVRNEDNHVLERAKLCTKMNHYHDNKSAKRILEFLELDGANA